ncbi:MAG TPA: SHOCT domain-containing protein [Solirubrobacteraceae bacterium]|nr:SHOCT domain-containing protein [Solirubrobacteraceae bacterium]
MFVRRRRPLLGAAMLGGTYMAGRASQRAAYREDDEEQRIQALEQQSAPAAPAPAAAPAAPAAAPSAGGELVAQLNQLSSLKQSGALSAEEFEAAKQKLLAG